MSSDKSQCVNDRLSKDLKEQEDINVVAIDCEMVGTRRGSILARVSIVNSKGETICDKFVKPTGKVIDYRTPVSGIRPRDIENGEAFAKVRQEVVKILKNKILVGHGVKHDLEVLQISHPEHMIRDTSLHWKVKESSKLRTPSLKFLAKRLLGVTIQEGEHSSVEDAKAALQVYLKERKNWESS
ncbi:RNA exonuclease 4-like [Aphis gossypii]|uniref:RNA exonuclease 4-like n=1 Tax=Aphis gossypii TaxID=80765 RepID=UPI00100EB0F8|nr:RNA exonuclease 4-like [Aphis gossypii]